MLCGDPRWGAPQHRHTLFSKLVDPSEWSGGAVTFIWLGPCPGAASPDPLLRCFSRQLLPANPVKQAAGSGVAVAEYAAGSPGEMCCWKAANDRDRHWSCRDVPVPNRFFETTGS